MTDASPPDTVVCDRCEAVCQRDDNFCRKCGLSLRVTESLPSVRPSVLPAIRQPSVPATMARGAVFVAAGKLAEVLFRRAVRRVFERDANGKHLPATNNAAIADDPDGDIFSETVILRHVRLRR